MFMHALRRRIPAIGTALGLGIALPFAVGVTPAHAVAQVDITKTHTGDFARGGQGVYTITVTNSGDETLSGTLMTDALPTGLTLTGLTITDSDSALSCQGTGGSTGIQCEGGSLPVGGSWTLSATVAVAADAPCTLTNTANVTVPTEGPSDSASDPTTVTGGSCDDTGGGGSILPINLNGVIPMFNNITTNNNIHSPGASNVSSQTFGVDAP